ncbi:hypothetical protein DH2020_015801 [Rehmannia glutinosa]|uniref:SWIM-type domain-containing protein n=1 Tax=Rehmannia glutinosa TaxID=99300 RepID=A0ABR0WX74_REHGL
MLRDAREYPLVSLLDAILMMLMWWYAERRNVAIKMKYSSTDWAEKIVRERDEKSRRMDVQTSHYYTYYVLDGDRNAEVDLNARKCTCNVFQLDQLPCAHALAAARKVGMPRYELASQFYTTEALIAAFAEAIYPVGHVDFWNTPEEVSQLTVLPPIMRPPSGRPRKMRILSQGEQKMRRKCG